MRPPLSIATLSSSRLIECGPWWVVWVRPSRGENNVLALADVPGNDKPLDAVDDPEQDDAEQREDHKCREHGRQVEGTDRALQHVANAGIGADELTDHSADHGKRHRHLQTGE